MMAKVTNGRRQSSKTTTPMWCRTITKALDGLLCPSKEEYIKGIQNERRMTNGNFKGLSKV